MKDQQTLSRRRILQSLGSLGAATLLSGCGCLVRRDPKPVCPSSPEVSLPNGPLTIDAHCHVFNGTDLQVREFFSRVAIHQDGALGFGAKVLGSILQEIAWSEAPTGNAELTMLRDLSGKLEKCNETQYAKQVAEARQTAYSKGREQLQLAAQRSAEFRTLRENRDLKSLDLTGLDEVTSAKLQALALIDQLPPDVETYEGLHQNKGFFPPGLQGKTATGLIDFVLQNFQYRYVSVHDYLRTYNQKGSRVVDLMVPSMVDYDFWLGKGQETRTPLTTQVEVMRQIAILTGGRVHAFAPFNPLRQVAFDLKHTSTSSLDLVKDAIEKKGCIGVKIYPPMGFAALGNSNLRGKDGKSFWARDWLPGWTAREDFGRRLDDAMGSLFSWCELNDVPIMAHTNISNGVTTEFEELAAAKYWQTALSAFPKLRISFGHFGDTSPVEDGLTRARGFTALMASDPGKPGVNAYADAAYFVDVLRNRPELLTNIRQLYRDPVPAGRAPLAARFMYGTDWEMTLTEGAIKEYLTDFVKLFEGMEAQPAVRRQGVENLSNRFFGVNAANWMGLNRGEPARVRLERFYKSHDVPTPDWATKLG